MEIDFNQAEQIKTQPNDLRSLESVIENMSSFPGINDESGDSWAPGNSVTKRDCFLKSLGFYGGKSSIFELLKNFADRERAHPCGWYADLVGFGTYDGPVNLQQRAAQIVNESADPTRPLWRYEDWRLTGTEYALGLRRRFEETLARLIREEQEKNHGLRTENS